MFSLKNGQIMASLVAHRNDQVLNSPFRALDGLQQASYDLSRASYLAGDHGRLSPQALKSVGVLSRHAQVDRNRFSSMQRWKAGHLEAVHNQICQSFPTFQRRKEIEDQVAEYLDRYVQERGDHFGFLDLAEKMRLCRTSGTVGLLPDGRHVTAWDCKCGCPRLCPHESRVQTKRVIRQYVPAIQSWVDEHPLNEVHYVVFTLPNFPAGQLHEGKRAIMKRFQEQVLRATRPVTDADREEYGFDGRKRKMDLFPGIQGAFVCQEDPLAADCDSWNVHINAVILVRGHLCYKQLRQAWGGFNLHARRLKTDPDSLAHSILEVVKYSVEHVTPKSEEKAAEGKSRAPGLTDWSFDRFSEWWAAGRKFRRIRSYGCLYKLSEEPSDGLDEEPIEWIGSVRRSEDGAYWVDLIQGNNFSQRSTDPTDLELLEDLDDLDLKIDPGRFLS